MYCCRVVQFVLPMDEAALHDVGHLPSLLFCGTPQEPEEAWSVVRCDLATVIPLTTHTYGHSPLGCYIHSFNNTNRIAFIQRYALWEVPASAVLFAASTAMVVMVIKLACGIRWRLKYEPITDSDPHWKVLKQLLPLSVFPIVSLMFLVPVSVYSYSAESSTVNKDMKLTAAVCFSLWSMASGATLIVHISVAHLCHKRFQGGITPYSRSNTVKVKVSSEISSTHFSPQHEDDLTF